MNPEEENEEPLGYELVCYFEESQTLFEATREGHRRPDSVDIAEADDWRPRRRVLSPSPKDSAAGYHSAELRGDFYRTPSEAGKRVAIEKATFGDNVAVRNLRFRAVPVGLEGRSIDASLVVTVD